MSKILVADDEKEIVEILEMVLTSAGHKVFTALNGETAVETAKKEKPDIIFLDLCFPKPGLDGVEILKAIREFDENVKIVLTSGLDNTDGKYKEAQDLGVSKCLSKPINVSNIKTIVSELLK